MRMVAIKNMVTETDLSFLNLSSAYKARSFHKNFPMYQETPLVSRKENAKSWGIDDIFMKDEAFRFGLNAFKVLGGSYAIGNLVADRLNIKLKDLSFEIMTSSNTRKELGDITFVTATDGNHGRGIAWTAKQLKQKAVIYMPKKSSPERLHKIQAEGAFACITEYNYDGCVRLAKERAEKNGWIVVQDTSWEGYTLIPTWIMQGYTTMILEAYERLPKQPTHIFVQAGVGSLAAAVTGFFSLVYPENKPTIVIIEPEAADCFFRSAQAGDGVKRIVEGDMNTIMAGLACGEPCSIGWDIIKNYADFVISCSDAVTEKGMKLLARPKGKDKKITSGESGAVGFGCLAELLTNPSLQEMKETLKLDASSVVLLFNTEGATDPESYDKIIGQSYAI